jgi:hypothetical protein
VTGPMPCNSLCWMELRKNLAEREGFEPPIPFQVCRFSRPEPSTTRPPLRLLQFYYSPPAWRLLLPPILFEFKLITNSYQAPYIGFKTACFNHSHIPPELVKRNTHEILHMTARETSELIGDSRGIHS